MEEKTDGTQKSVNENKDDAEDEFEKVDNHEKIAVPSLMVGTPNTTTKTLPIATRTEATTEVNLLFSSMPTAAAASPAPTSRMPLVSAISRTPMRTTRAFEVSRKPSKWRKKYAPLPVAAEDDLIMAEMKNDSVITTQLPTQCYPTEFTALSQGFTTNDEAFKTSLKKIQKEYALKALLVGVAAALFVYQMGCALGLAPTLSHLVGHHRQHNDKETIDVVKNFHSQLVDSISVVKWTDEISDVYTPKQGSVCDIIHIGEWSEWKSASRLQNETSFAGKEMRSHKLQVLDPGNYELDCPPNVQVRSKIDSRPPVDK